MSCCVKEENEKRLFSDHQHQLGRWNTEERGYTNQILRFFWRCISLKRRGVDALAKKDRGNECVLELGSGTGAYSHWYCTSKHVSVLFVVDWSFYALKRINQPPNSNMYRICADIHQLPFKENSFSLLFSIDTIGHLSHVEGALDEINRVSALGCTMFLHSECNDYQNRWPDSVLINSNHKDVIAEMDGHYALLSSRELRNLYQKNFTIQSFYSPAGLCGWLIGYPEKYHCAFSEAHCFFLSQLTLFFSQIKKFQFSGVILKMLNSLTNYFEIIMGLQGGGSCFAHLINHKKKVSE